MDSYMLIIASSYSKNRKIRFNIEKNDGKNKNTQATTSSHIGLITNPVQPVHEF